MTLKFTQGHVYWQTNGRWRAMCIRR